MIWLFDDSLDTLSSSTKLRPDRPSDHPPHRQTVGTAPRRLSLRRQENTRPRPDRVHPPDL